MKFIKVLPTKFSNLLESFSDKNSFKQKFLTALPFWIGALATGIIAVIYAKLFLLAEHLSVYIFEYNKWYFLILTPLVFLMAWWLVRAFAPYSRGSGIPQVSTAIELATPGRYHLIKHLLSLKVIVVKVLSTLLMVAGGGAIGREGPTIQIAGSIFKKINDWLPSNYPKISRVNMLVTGAAAGLAAAFNTPLGGIVFAIEELAKTHFNTFKSALLTGVIIAGLTALNISGPYLYLGYPKVDNLTVWIILPVIIVALIAGIMGSWMCKIILYVLKKKKSLTSVFQNCVYVGICGLLMAALAIFIDVKVFASGKEIMTTVLFTESKEVEWYIPILRFIGPIISFTAGGAGGVFAPALSAGASIGAVVSEWFSISSTDTNLIVLCGMVAFLTGVTRGPFTSSILVLEMTNSHNTIFYLMLAGLVASLISKLVAQHSFYEKLGEQYMEELTDKKL